MDLLEENSRSTICGGHISTR